MSDKPGAKAGYIHAPLPLHTTPPKGRANHSGLVYGLWFAIFQPSEASPCLESVRECHFHNLCAHLQ